LGWGSDQNNKPMDWMRQSFSLLAKDSQGVKNSFRESGTVDANKTNKSIFSKVGSLAF